MALQSSFYTTDGTTRTFPSTKHIATKQHVAVYLKKVSDSTWELSNSDSYELVNNAVIFIEAPDIAIYSQIEVRVADTAGELSTSPSDIAIVAGLASDIELIADNINDVNTVATNIGSVGIVSGSISNVNTVSGSIGSVNTVSSNISNVNTVASNIADIDSVATTVVPNITEILLADNNATIATTQAGIATTKASESTASALEAEHWANYTVDAAVPEGTGEFSAKHYATKANEYATSINPSNIMHLTGNESASGIKIFTDGINAPQLVGFKNYIINGNFDIWQRGTSQTSSGFGSDDRWSNQNVGSTKTHSQVACTDTERALFNASKFSRTVVASVAGASNFVIKRQTIEDVTKLAGKTVTISFWAKADGNKNIAIELQQSFGTGGSPSASVDALGSQLIALTSTWQKKTITVNIPSTVGKTLGTDGVHTSSTTLRFWFDSGSSFNSSSASLGQQSGTFDIAQVQLEEGSMATAFEHRPIGLELSLCQRYYEATEAGNASHWFVGNGTAGTDPIGTIYFKTKKRVAPTVSIFSWFDSTPNAVEDSSGNNISVTAGYIGDSSFSPRRNNVALTNGVAYSLYYTASAEL